VTANILAGLRIDEYFVRSDATGSRTLLSDALGSTVALLDKGGTVQTTYTYEPFGSTTATGEASANTFQYTGRENDQTGPFYYRARYYKPQYQRFIGEDPIGMAGGNTNLYVYVLNNAVNLIDPTGLASDPHPGEVPGVPPARSMEDIDPPFYSGVIPRTPGWLRIVMYIISPWTVLINAFLEPTIPEQADDVYKKVAPKIEPYLSEIMSSPKRKPQPSPSSCPLPLPSGENRSQWSQ
jgi:RHS repeat-associated protein